MQVVSPLKEPRFGPKISSVTATSILIMGQFINPSGASKMSINDTRLDLTMVSRIFLVKEDLE